MHYAARVISLDDAVGRRDVGAKAERLARARAAGMRVPSGFIVLPDEEVTAEALRPWLERLGAGEGARFAVRSSADVEDRAGASAAGVFASFVPVAAEEVEAAVARVRESARGEPARAYFDARRALGGESSEPTAVRMAVLVHEYVAADRLGVLHTAPLVDGAMCAEERDPREPEWGEVTPRLIPPGDALARGALRLAALVGGEADVEYALTDGEVVFLQVRPLTAAPLAHDPSQWRLPTATATSRDDETTWVRDAEHNPEPLSTAQAGLVSLLEGRPGIPRQRVLNGYLYVEERADSAADAASAPPHPLDAWATFSVHSEALLAPLEDVHAGAPDLEAALSAFAAIASASMGALSPALRAARRALDAFLRRETGQALTAHGALLAGASGRTCVRDATLWAIGHALAGRANSPVADLSVDPSVDDSGVADPAVRAMLHPYADRFGAYAPVWDVAVPPDDEAPERVLATARLVAHGPSPLVRHEAAVADSEQAAQRLKQRLPSEKSAELATLLERARAANHAGEDDDALFFRAQRAVRRALLGRGRDLVARGLLDEAELVFEAPLDEVRAGRVDAAAARDRRARRAGDRKLSPPSRIERGVPRWRTLSASALGPSPSASGPGVLVGAGTSGRATGRVYRLLDPSAPPAALPPGAVLVVAAILPSLTFLISAAVALVTDHGGALSHAATLAREYGVPAVLGTGGATGALVDGEEVLVDADTGKVYRVGAGSRATDRT